MIYLYIGSMLDGFCFVNIHGDASYFSTLHGDNLHLFNWYSIKQHDQGNKIERMNLAPAELYQYKANLHVYNVLEKQWPGTASGIWQAMS